MKAIYRIVLSSFFFLFYFIHTGNAQCPVPAWNKPTGMPVLPARVVSDPVVGTNDDGRLEVFIVGGDGALWHSWQVQGNISQWSPWASFGSPPNSPLTAQESGFPVLSVSKDRDGRLQVFAVNGTVWQIGQAAKNVNWGGWRSLGRPQSPSGSAVGVWSVNNLDRRIELFIENSASGSLQHIWQLGDAFSWNGVYTEFGWPGSGGGGKLALALDKSGRIELATVSGGFAQIRRQRIPNTDWENWQSIGAPNGSAQLLPAFISLGTNADGRLELVAVENGAPWHTWQGNPQAGAAPPWTGQWASFGAPGNANVTDVKFVQGSLDCLTMVSLNTILAFTENEFGFISQKQPSVDWRTWVFLRNFPKMQTMGGLAVAKSLDGQMHVFVRQASADMNGFVLTTNSR
jgi:hypothetical protein